MYKRLRNLTLIGIVAIAIAGFVRVRSGMASTTAGSAIEESSTVEQGDILLTVSATSSLRAKQEVSLAFPVTGMVNVINVQEGDHVRKGQTIAILNSQTYLDAVQNAQINVETRKIALRRLTDKPRQVDIDVAQANLNLAKERLRSAKSGPDALQVEIDKLNVEKAKNGLWQTQLDRDSNNAKKELLQSNPATAGQADLLPSDVENNKNLTSRDYDVQIAQSQLAGDAAKSGNVGSIAQAEAQVVSAEIELNKLIRGADKNDLVQAESQLKAAEEALEQARQNLAKATLTAPFDGVIARLNLHLGERTPTGAAVVMLDTSSYYLDVAIDERDINRVAVGQTAVLAFDALPGVSINGKVIYVAQTSTRTGDVVTYTVRIELDPAGHPLLSAMSTTISIVTDQVKDVLRVRNRFIRLDRSANKAYAIIRQTDGTFAEIEVQLGLRNDVYSEVKGGLQEGDMVVILQSNVLPTPASNRPRQLGE